MKKWYYTVIVNHKVLTNREGLKRIDETITRAISHILSEASLEPARYTIDLYDYYPIPNGQSIHHFGFNVTR